MTKIYKAFILLAFLLVGKSYSQICNAGGNLVIYSNYDGGIININCDVNIPNLKIGICTYEAAEIHIIGTFSNNVTGVIYAGYDGGNDNCTLGVTSTSIVGSSTQTINLQPNVGYSPVHGNGWPQMVGCYQCDTTTSSGGVCSPDEVVYYFMNQFPGSVLRSHHTQYGCWLPTTFNLSAGGNCCIMPATSVSSCTAPPAPTNITSVANQNICAGSTTTLAVNSSTTVNWFASSTSTTVIGVGTSFITNTLSAGNYTFYAAAVNSCSNSPKIAVSVTVNPLPTLSVASTQSICAGQVATISVSGASTYSWSTTQTTSLISVSPSSTTVYTVTGTSSSNCKNTATVSVMVTTCTALYYISTSQVYFNVYPNPANKLVNVVTGVGEKRLMVKDITGKLIIEMETQETLVRMDVSFLAKGLYIVSILQNGTQQHQKLLIE